MQLTFFALFQPKADGVKGLAPLVGAESLRLDGASAQADVTSIPFHLRSMDRLAPRSGGLLGLFGIRDTLEELQHWRTVARHSKAEFGSLHVQVNIAHPWAGVVTREVLRERAGDLRFLNIRRNAAGLQKELLQKFASWVREEGGDPSLEMAHVQHMAHRPDLYARTLEQDSDFRHIDVLVFPLADRSDPRLTRQVAYLRAGARIQELRQGDTSVQLQLPRWMVADGEAVVSSGMAVQPMLPSTLSSLPSGTSLNDSTLSPLANKRA